LVTFVAGQATGLGMALLIAWVEMRWRRQEVRAAEKRARLDEQFRSVRQYAAGLRQFVHDAVGLMTAWKELRPVEAPQLPERLVERLLCELEERWHEVEKLEPQPRPWFVVGDRRVRAALAGLEIGAELYRARCRECLEAGDMMSEEEANRFRNEAGENLKKMLKWMEKAVEEAE